jgi:hypothetical protein
MSPLFSRGGPSKRQIARQERERAEQIARQERIRFEQVAARERGQFESLAIKAAHGDVDALGELPSAAQRVREFYQDDNQYWNEAWAAMTVALRDILADDVMTEQKETHVAQLSFALGIQQWGVDLPTRNFALYEEVMVARINDGRPVENPNAPLIAQPGEISYFPSFSVALMKEVVDREMRGGSQGVSVRIAKGVTYRVGQVRARSVVVGSHLEAADYGDLVVTNRRAVFMGAKKTLEFRRDKLVGLAQYSDGLRLSVSNRQTASLLRFGQGSSPTIAAALLSAA